MMPVNEQDLITTNSSGVRERMKPELKSALKVLADHCAKQCKGKEDCPEVCNKCELVDYCEGVIPQWVVE